MAHSVFRVPETVNLHISAYCNLRCVYCYGSFPERPPYISVDAWKHILDGLLTAGVKRANFSGGEPTLYPRFHELVAHAKAIGLQPSIITNGKKLTDETLKLFDLVGLSIDSADDAVSAKMGRVDRDIPSYREFISELALRAKKLGTRVKINTVVTALNIEENLSELYLALRPEKIKLLQFTEVLGENDASADKLRVSDEQFRRFADRHTHLSAQGIWVEPEPASTIAATYVMIDPSGRLFQHNGHGHSFSRPLTECTLAEAMRETGGYNRDRFEERGGHRDVRSLPILGRSAPSR
jgi:radical S-adenosyl methionine domain-containing protein 2